MAAMKKTLIEYLQSLDHIQRAELAEKVGASPRYLYRIGAGFDPLPSLTLAAKIADASGGKIKLRTEYPLLGRA